MAKSDEQTWVYFTTQVSSPSPPDEGMALLPPKVQDIPNMLVHSIKV